MSYSLEAQLEVGPFCTHVAAEFFQNDFFAYFKQPILETPALRTPKNRIYRAPLNMRMGIIPLVTSPVSKTTRRVVW